MPAPHPLSTVPVVRVVIPCRNEEPYIGALLLSIIGADRANMRLEVDVCDGMSDDGTRGIVEHFATQHAWIRLVDNPQRTTPQALNLGLKREGYDIGIIMGAHAEVAQDFFQENIRALREHPEAGCVGGVIENVYANDVSRAIGAAMSSPIGVGNAHFRTGLKSGHVDTVAFGAYRREVFDQVGWFDERLVRNQDDEFNFRLLRSGQRIWLSDGIRCKYYVRASYGKLYRQYSQYGYWKVFVNRSHRTITTGRQLIPAVFVLFAVLGGVACLFWPKFNLVYGPVMSLYVLLLFVVALRAVGPLKARLGVPRAIVIMHMAYGVGYLRGILDFLVLGRQPSGRSHTLTR